MNRSAGASPNDFGFRCQTCGDWHVGLPALEVPGPANLLAIPEAERAERCIVETDFCIVDEAAFYMRGLVELPIVGSDRSFVWMVWISVSEASLARCVDMFEEPKRSHVAPFFGWLDCSLPLYPETRALKATVHLRDDFLRPSVVLEPTDHPLAVEQRQGIAVARVSEILAGCRHGFPPA